MPPNPQKADSASLLAGNLPNSHNLPSDPPLTLSALPRANEPQPNLALLPISLDFPAPAALNLEHHCPASISGRISQPGTAWGDCAFVPKTACTEIEVGHHDEPAVLLHGSVTAGKEVP